MSATPIEASAPDAAAVMWPRLSTGNDQADEILGGGYPIHSINIIMGQPGTGKTIFAEQLLFHHAAADRPLLYITTLSEPLTKVVSYVQRFAFYDEAKLGTQLVYEDLGAALSADGPSALATYLRDAIKTLSPRIIVVDSFRAIHDLAQSPLEMRVLISELAGLLSAYDVTTFLIGEYDGDSVRKLPEFAVADSIVEFARQPLSSRDERFLRVLKLRGSAYREGQHAFRISNQGLEIFPRLVAPRGGVEYEPTIERAKSGVPGLDEAIGGGLWRGSTTLLVGPTGSGKTTLALQFALEGLRSGEPTMYVNFQENPAQLRRLTAALGASGPTPPAGEIEFVYVSPVELQIDSFIGSIFQQISRRGIRRVVIDALGDLSVAANDSQRLHDYLYSLVQHFAVRNVNSILTFEASNGIRSMTDGDQRFSYISDNVFQLEVGTETRSTRRLRVIKTRNSGHDPRPRDLELDERGVRLL